MLDKIKITDITPADYNPRKISNDDYEKLSRNISEFGLVSPIIINLQNNHIIGGHQRYDVLLNEYMVTHKYEELNLLKLGDIGWVFADEDIDIEDENFEKALNLSLNKIDGYWDNQKLNDLFIDFELDGFDINLTGFTDDELSSFEFKKGVGDEDYQFNDSSEIAEYVEKEDNDDEDEFDDEIDDEILEEFEDDIKSNKKVLRISGMHIDVTDEEIEKLNILLKNYVEENRVPIGFPRYLIEEVK